VLRVKEYLLPEGESVSAGEGLYWKYESFVKWLNQKPFSCWCCG
jgi:hypothetical protein